MRVRQIFPRIKCGARTKRGKHELRRRHAGILPAVVRWLVAQHGMLACFHRETNSLDLHYVNVHRRLLRRSGRKNLLL